MKKIFLKDKEVEYRVIKKPIKHLYLRVRDNYIEISCNSFVTNSYIQKFIKRNEEYILNKLNSKEFYYLFGKKYKNENINLKELYKAKLPQVIEPLVKSYSEKMKLYPTKISYRFNKTRWGSCSFKNSITFNYYLAKLPLEVIKYVVVHELAHIKHKNHSKEFWELVQSYLPNTKELKRILREYERVV